MYCRRPGQVIANAAGSGLAGGNALCRGGCGWNWTAVPNGNPKTFTTAPPRPAVPGGVLCGGGGSADGDLLTTMVAAVVAAIKTDDGEVTGASRPGSDTRSNAGLRQADAGPALPLRVETPHGTLEGLADEVKGARVFLGVPFAAPPLGALRFALPRPAPRWGGVRAAKHWAPGCLTGGKGPS